MSKYTHTSAFEYFGLKLRNTQWSWSSRCETRKIVAVTLWQDEFTDKGKTYSISGSDQATPDVRLGFRELMNNLQWAQDHCNGCFNVVMAYAQDPSAARRRIKESFPWPIMMKWTHLDTATGAWKATRLDL
jgi:hypothetical protein